MARTAKPRLTVVRDPDAELNPEVRPPRGAKSELYCMDPAFGHDWDDPTWEDGPTYKHGRSTVYHHHRLSRCVRCGTVRVEVFEQSARYLEKLHNRYRYSALYKQRNRMTYGELRMQMWREETTA